MATSYTMDVRPLFRAKDVACMAQKGVMLGDADWMCDPATSDEFVDHGNARKVFSVLSEGQMPPDGAWTQARLDVYKQWMQDGFVK